MPKVIDIFTGKGIANAAEREAAQAATPVAVATRLAVGCTLENGTLRTHRFRDHLVLWDLTNAGKRGKKVSKLNLQPSFKMSAAHRDAVLEQISILLENLQSYEVAAAVLSQLAAASKTIDLSTTEERGVDVIPASFKTITIKTDTLELTASYADFTVRCLKDRHNLPTTMPAIKNGKKSVQQFYTWVSANQERIKTMSYHEVQLAMREQGIRYHSYCAMD